MRVSTMKFMDWKIEKHGKPRKGFCGHTIRKGEKYLAIPYDYYARSYCVKCGIKIIPKAQKELHKLFAKLLMAWVKEEKEVN